MNYEKSNEINKNIFNPHLYCITVNPEVYTCRVEVQSGNSERRPRDVESGHRVQDRGKCTTGATRAKMDRPEES